MDFLKNSDSSLSQNSQKLKFKFYRELKLTFLKNQVFLKIEISKILNHLICKTGENSDIINCKEPRYICIMRKENVMGGWQSH